MFLDYVFGLLEVALHVALDYGALSNCVVSKQDDLGFEEVRVVGAFGVSEHRLHFKEFL